eukprot:TRINITY_DN4799_c0_g1_i1.p2 TRINITY_DN4799_c0_g1~~TRINITY_DN4799_c0_g1_i1.p2  ORF type:complete len:640 (-),score=303.96 TRINITY_DN4799_c0_g1_i1:123-2042(-)
MDAQAQQRIHRLLSHINPSDCSLYANSTSAVFKDQEKEEYIKALLSTLRGNESPIYNSSNLRYNDPEAFMSELKWNGWGYRDTDFALLNEQLELTGERYDLSGKAFPLFRIWAEKVMAWNIDLETQEKPEPTNYPEPIFVREFFEDIKGHFGYISFSGAARLLHGHGHTAHDIYNLRFGSFERLPDVVVWPGNQEQVEVIVKAAKKHNIVIIPYGGGTSVTHGIECPTKEKRMIVSLDMHLMNRIKWIDRTSMIACIETGIVGKELERRLGEQGLCMGHEPDSIEFSTLGGWIATRASGMKKNVYGNIEDILIQCKLVTPEGLVEKKMTAPRVSVGPDVNQYILGSEGTLGVITEAIVKIHSLPAVKKYGSVVFPHFDDGVAFMHHIARVRAAPASIRLMDNPQFLFGMALKPAVEDRLKAIVDSFKKFYLTKIKGYGVEQMSVATILFQGDADQVAAQQKKIYEIASLYKGLEAGEENGLRGYFMTFMIAYLRDFSIRFNYLAESFETSVPWSNVPILIKNVKETIFKSCRDQGITEVPFVCCRVTQTYDMGACVYFYFAFLARGLSDPVGTYEHIEDEAREEVLANGGTLSHHHGVGKLRRKYLPRTMTPLALETMKAIKKTLDPTNVFANGNLFEV